MQDPSAYFLQQYRFESTRKQHLRFRFFALIASILILGSIGWFNKTLSFTGMVVFESIAIRKCISARSFGTKKSY